MENLKEKLLNLNFARNVWANKRLSRLCPNNNIARFKEVLEIEDTTKQFEAMEDIIIIMHEAYEVQQRFNGVEFEPFKVTREMLDMLDEDELMVLINQALATFDKDGEVTVEVEPKGSKKKEATKSI